MLGSIARAICPKFYCIVFQVQTPKDKPAATHTTSMPRTGTPMNSSDKLAPGILIDTFVIMSSASVKPLPPRTADTPSKGSFSGKRDSLRNFAFIRDALSFDLASAPKDNESGSLGDSIEQI